MGTWGGGLSHVSSSGLLLRRGAETVPEPPGLSDRDVTALARDAENGLWIGTRNATLLRKHPGTGEYLDFPDVAGLVGFDRSDRKFAAAARKAGVPVANAVDRDWLEHFAALTAANILVQFVCGCDPANWFE